MLVLFFFSYTTLKIMRNVVCVYALGATKVLGAHEPQCSTWKWAFMQKVFIVIIVFLQACAN